MAPKNLGTRPVQHTCRRGKAKNLPVSATCISDVGKAREINEDNFYLGLDDGIFIVSDGMGGHQSGEIASRIVVEILPPILAQSINASKRDEEMSDFPTLARQAVIDLNNLLNSKAGTEPGLYGMGATLGMAWLTGAHSAVYVVNVGDSRIYLFHRGILSQLSRDHSIVALLVQQEEIRAEEAHDHPARGRLYRYIGMAGEAIPEVQCIHPQPGDLLLLCSDGLTDHVSDPEIQAVLVEYTDLLNACQTLVDAANREGGRDNITVMLVKWE